MIGLAARLIGGMVTPLIDRLSASSARLLRKLALFVVTAVALVVVVIALTLAFGLWISSLYGGIVGALAVAGVYCLVGAGALFLALRPAAPPSAADKASSSPRETAEKAEAARQGGQIDDFAAPLLSILQNLGLRREQLAVLAGTSVAKQLGPVPLVGLAIVAGFLIGRMWDGWRTLVSGDLVAAILSSGLFGREPKTDGGEEEA